MALLKLFQLSYKHYWFSDSMASPKNLWIVGAVVRVSMQGWAACQNGTPFRQTNLTHPAEMACQTGMPNATAILATKLTHTNKLHQEKPLSETR